LRISPVLIPMTALLFGAACSTQGPGPAGRETISREAFVEVFIDLRVTALRTPGLEITVSARDRILQTHQLTKEDLEGFVEIWGEDPTFMEGIWEEVSNRLQEVRSNRGEAEGDQNPPEGGR